MRPRVARVRAIATKKRAEHPELRRPTLAGVLAVCERQGIDIIELPLSPGHDGWAMVLFGKSCIMLSTRITNRRRKLSVLLHELGHVVLGHVSDTKMLERRRTELNPRWIEKSEGWRLVENPSPTESVIEAEADLFRDLFLTADREDPQVTATLFHQLK